MCIPFFVVLNETTLFEKTKLSVMVREGSGQHNINFINQCTLQHNTDDADYDDDDTNDDDLIMKIA